MCGVFGFALRSKQAGSVVLDGLRDLEYRGYDSWGIVALDGEKLFLQKEVGQIGQAKSTLPKSHLALGHTRWATHGGVTRANAHPHLDEKSRFAVVHNGIVENFSQLKEELLQMGHRFSSETDSEVLVHMYEVALENHSQHDPLSAFLNVWSELHGLNAVVVLDGKNDQLLFGKMGSPLALGRSENGWYIASDGMAFPPEVKKVCFLEDGWYGHISQSECRVFSADKKELQPEWKTLKRLQIDFLNERDFPHMMLKEITEQSLVLERISALPAEDFSRLTSVLRESKEIIFLGCGTAYHASLFGQQFFLQMAGRVSEALLASESSSRLQLVTSQTALVALSQSGETIDVIEPCTLAQKKKARLLSLVNAPYSTLYRMSDGVLLLNAGREKAVASTKAFTAKLALLYRLAAQIGGRDVSTEMEQVAQAVATTVKARKKIRSCAEQLVERNVEHFFVLGKGLRSLVARETALKVKEISYIHAEGMSSSELKHGTLALIESGVPCLFFLPEDPRERSEIFSSIAEVKARGGLIIGCSSEPSELFDVFLPSEPGTEIASLFSQVIIGQLLAYELTVLKGLNPDRPRNLAKSVTVK